MAASPRVHLRPEVAHPGRGLCCRQRSLHNLPLRPEVDHRVGDLGRVRDLDPAEAVPAAELDALAQPVVGADHPATHIFGVAQPAQGCGLQFGRSGPAREIEGLGRARAGSPRCRRAGKQRLPRR